MDPEELASCEARRRALIMPQARDEAAAARLWKVSEQLTGTSFE
jgi:hypothetical protein